MQQRTLGSSDLKLSAVGLGANNFGGRMDTAQVRAVVHKALDCGVTLIDTADAYGPDGKSEAAIGDVLGPRRKDMVLATKFGLDISGNHKLAGGSRAYVMKAVEGSLKRLRTDWIDLYQMHYPDPDTPIEETLRAIDDLVKQGKVRHIGHSNATGKQLDEAMEASKTNNISAFISSQDQYSLLNRKIEAGLLPSIEKHHLGFLPYFPLASGMLTGKHKRGVVQEGSRLAYSKRHIDRFINDANWAKVEALTVFAEKRGHTILELAFAWLLAKPFIGSVISGASTPEQVEHNVKAVGWALTPADMAELDQITR
jgi:aryl-alcohol dehydrogenase-like predicted oxidoreductase